MLGTFGTSEPPLTVKDLLDELCDLPLDTPIYTKVDCPHLSPQVCRNVELLVDGAFIYGVMIS